MGLLFANNASSTLTGAVTSTATTVVVQSADATLFPAFVAADDYFMLVIEDRNQNPVLREIVKCTARTANSLTVIRAQESTTAQNWAAGVTVSNRLTAGALATLAAGVNVTTQLYLGSFNAAPTKTLENRSLIAGNLYYDTTLGALQQYSGTGWAPVTTQTRSLAFGQYLGSFATPPITMPDGTALVIGTLYFDSTGGGLRVWSGGAWVASTGTATTPASTTTATNNLITGNQTVTGDVNVTGTGHFSNVIADLDVSASTLHLGGLLVTPVGDISGDGFSQNFPSGLQLRFGTGQCNAVAFAGVSVPFNATFASPPIVLVSAAANAAGAFVVWGAITTTSFTVARSVGSGSSTPFSWIAIGVRA